MNNQRGSAAPIAAIIFAVAALVLSGWFFMMVQTKVKERVNTNTTTTQNTSSGTVVNTNVTTNTNSNLNSNSATNTNASSNTNSNTNSTINSTQDWKTYTNVEYGFSFKYPDSYSVKENGLTFAVAPLDGSYPSPFIQISTDSINTVITDNVDQEVSRESVKAGSISGLKIVEDMAIGGEGLNYVFSHQGKTYLLRGTNSDIDQNIFSTFTFTN